MGASPELQIAGFEVCDFLTLGRVAVEPSGPLTVVCGPNNVGKSSLLRALGLAEVLAQVAHGQRSKEDLDGLVRSKTRASLAIDPESAPFTSLLDHQSQHLGRATADAVAARVKEQHGLIWLHFAQSDRGWQLDEPATVRPVEDRINEWGANGTGPSGWKAIPSIGGVKLTRQGNQFKLPHEWARAVAKAAPRSRVEFIPDVRRSVNEPLERDDLWALSKATARSTVGHRVENWADKLGHVLKDVFGDDVQYEVRPTDGSGDFRLRIDGEDDVRLDHVGAGIREVVAVAYAALHVPAVAVLAIEEPENCLHPAAARRLVQSLPRRTDAQLFVSTHSSAVVNANPDTVLHLSRIGGETSSQQVDDAPSRYEAVRAMGYAPADLVLAPAAVWVEGPSDRLYFSAWLRTHGLVEGIDYQMMFYAGALAAHVTADGYAPSGSALAAIRTLGRRCAVIADSDRSSKGAHLKKHVRRFKDELETDPHGHLLITWGREVENYVPRSVVNDIRVSRGVPRILEAEYRYARVIDSRLSKRMKKTTFAEEALTLLDGQVPETASKQVRELATFIRESVPG